MKKQLLLRALTGAGIGSRRRLATAIKDGRVEVNGEVVEGFNQTIDPTKDRVCIDGKAVRLEAQPFVYLVLNKPKGILSTVKDELGRQTVISILPKKYKGLRLYPVGRLDRDSTGLTMLTNDGDLAHRLIHPSFEHEKEYLVKVKTLLKRGDIQRLEQGIRLEDGKTAPAKVKRLAQGEYNYSITIHEGKKRQLRRMFQALGHPVLELKRIRMGSIKLGDLKEGGMREIRSPE